MIPFNTSGCKIYDFPAPIRLGSSTGVPCYYGRSYNNYNLFIARDKYTQFYRFIPHSYVYIRWFARSRGKAKCHVYDIRNDIRSTSRRRFGNRNEYSEYYELNSISNIFDTDVKSESQTSRVSRNSKYKIRKTKSANVGSSYLDGRRITIGSNPTTCYDYMYIYTKLIFLWSVMETLLRVQVWKFNNRPRLWLPNSGLRQSYSLSPNLFDVVSEKVIGEIQIGPREGTTRLQDTWR